MTDSPYIIWEPKYSVHVDILDEQHQKLFDIANELLDTLKLGSGNLLPVIQELVDYLAKHFHQENIVMMNSNYPGYEKHSREHQRFTQKVEEFLGAYSEGNPDLGREMMLFMKDWIFTHTTRLDMQYADHLAKNAEELTRSGKVPVHL